MEIREFPPKPFDKAILFSVKKETSSGGETICSPTDSFAFEVKNCQMHKQS